MLSISDFRPTLRLLAALFALSSATATSAQQVQTTQRVTPTTSGASLSRADSAWTAGAYPLAASLYEAIVVRDSSAGIAVLRLGILRSWDNRLDEASTLFRRYIVLAPRDNEGRLGLARTAAYGGRYDASVAIYDSIVRREPNNRDAVLGRAQTLAWAGNLSDALRAYERWMAAHPNDRGASVEYARALSWDGQLGRAEAMYAELSRTGYANAKKGLARVIAWRGDLTRSERTWRQVLVTDPADPEALTGLAEVLSWQGRQADAETALQLALQANPAYGDARALLRWVQADLRPSMTVSGVGANDSDENRSTGFVLDYVTRAPWNGSMGARYSERWASFPAIDSRADWVNVFGRWQPAGTTWQIRADAGATRHSSNFVLTPRPQQTIFNGGLRATGMLGRSLRIGLGASRMPFNETAKLIATGVVSSEVIGEAEVALPGPFSLAAGGSHARLTGGTAENSRNAFSSSIRWIRNRHWSLGIGARQFGYDTTSTDGYFAPKRYTLAEVSGRGRLGGDLGWTAEGEAGVGRQDIEFFGSSAGSRRAERVALTAGYRFGPAHEFSASGSYANVAGAGQTGGSEYRFYSFALRARLGL